MTVMSSKTFTSREFNQKTNEAKKAAEWGPVYITDRGAPAFVLMSIVEYRKLTNEPRPEPMSLAEALEQKSGPEIVFEFELPPRSRVSSLRDPEF